MKQPQPTKSRIFALSSLIEIKRGKIRAGDLLYGRLEKLTPADRALTTRLVLGVLRLQGQLDMLWETHSRRPRSKVDPMIAEILRLGVYQLFFCDGIAPYAAVNESVLLTRHFGRTSAASFVNAVLRALSNSPPLPFPEPDPSDSLSRQADLLSHPQWLVKRWIKRFGFSDTVNLCRFNNKHPIHFIRVNALITTPEKVISLLRQKGWNPQPVEGFPEAIIINPTGNPTTDSGYLSGYYDIQSLPSILIGHVTAPEEGERVLDACAGRGGKTMHLAQLMRAKGTVVAGDIRLTKLRLLKNNQHRLKVEIIHPIGYNCAEAVFGKKFDRILLDAPCTGLGVTGRYPDIKWIKKEEEIKKAGRLQRSLLSHIAGYLTPGGVLVYAVCSVEPEETQQVIEDFLSRYSGFEREDIRDYLPDPLRESVTPEGYWLPQHSGMEGFFCARLRKICRQ